MNVYNFRKKELVVSEINIVADTQEEANNIMNDGHEDMDFESLEEIVITIKNEIGETVYE